MIKCTLHQVLRLPNRPFPYIKISLKRGKVYYIVILRLFHLYNNCDITFLTVFILTHPVNFPCGRKSEHPEKTHDIQQSVDRLFSHESVARIEPRGEKRSLYEEVPLSPQMFRNNFRVLRRTVEKQEIKKLVLLLCYNFGI
jgi:hypothetical protein